MLARLLVAAATAAAVAAQVPAFPYPNPVMPSDNDLVPNNPCISAHDYANLLQFHKSNFNCTIGWTSSPSQDFDANHRYCLKDEDLFEKACSGGKVCRVQISSPMDSLDTGTFNAITKICYPSDCDSSYTHLVKETMYNTVCNRYFNTLIQPRRCSVHVIDCGVLEIGYIANIAFGAALIIFGVIIIVARIIYVRKRSEECPRCKKRFMPLQMGKKSLCNSCIKSV